ncbi:MAG: hypothetical protein COA43_03070 [Robiginitomaculum sp.]|nr:MAG: hypothetical protein COA43_03070 [Robiginitomaculum sp.]
MSALILLISENIDEPWDWANVSTNEIGRAESNTDKTALTQLDHKQLIAVLPGMQIITKLNTLEALNTKQLHQAIGFDIEDDLAQPLDAVHISFDKSNTRLAIVSKTYLGEVITCLEEIGLSPDILCADYDILPTDIGLVYDNRFIQSAENGLGFSIDTHLSSHVLGAHQNLPSPITVQQYLQKITSAYAQGHTALNLRQGEFVKRTALGAGRYKRALILAAACCVMFVGLNIGQGLVHAKNTKAAKTNTDKIYAEIFKTDEKSPNPVLAVLKAQSEVNAKSENEFIKLSKVLAVSIKQVKGVEIVAVTYDKGRSQLALSVTYKSFDDVEKLAAAIQINGGIFIEGGTRQDGDSLSGDAILKEAS